MPVTTPQLKAELAAEEIDYAMLAATYKTEALTAVEAIVADAESLSMTVAKATYLASLLKPTAAGSAAVIKSALQHAEAVVRVAAVAAAATCRRLSWSQYSSKSSRPAITASKRRRWSRFGAGHGRYPRKLCRRFALMPRGTRTHAFKRCSPRRSFGPRTSARPPKLRRRPNPRPCRRPGSARATSRRPMPGDGDGWGSVEIALGRPPARG